MPGPLDGVRVLDIGHYIAGPLAATLMGDYGADVVKVERPGGDPARKLGPLKAGISLWWKVSARNKRTISLDLTSPPERDTFLELVAVADVVVENYRPGTLERLGIPFPVLQETNPRIVLLSVSGYGQTGPMAAQPAFGRIAEAFSGLAHLTGDPAGPPMHAALPVADAIAGVFGALAVVSALHERNQSGIGQHIDLALYEATLRLMEFVPIAYDQLGVVTERPGAGHATVAPAGTWKTADGKWVTFLFGAGQEEMVRRMFDVLGRPELADDTRFSDNASRMANAQDLDRLIADWMTTRTRDEVVRSFVDAGLPITPVYDIEDAFGDEQYREREAFVRVDDDELGPVRMQNVVPRFSRTPGGIRHAGPPAGSALSAVMQDWL